jgi:tRNA A-37 threonylcarbamoyl transferase component Bud32
MSTQCSAGGRPLEKGGRVLDSRFALPAGTVLDGSYRIVRVVGTGGFGITYEAEDIALSTKVALKEYYPDEFGDRDARLSVRPKSERHKQTFEWGRQSFLKEARTLARFEHPSIVRVARVFEAHSTAYMVMGFERGQSFESWLKGLGRPPMQAELDAIVAPLLAALQVMHAANFLHRDIAPDNIIVRADGSPVLLDFGAARRSVAEMSRAMTGIVKAGYSPHEQYASDARLQGPWSDLYALGGTLYRAVTGFPPEEATLRVEGHLPSGISGGDRRLPQGPALRPSAVGCAAAPNVAGIGQRANQSGQAERRRQGPVKNAQRFTGVGTRSPAGAGAAGATLGRPGRISARNRRRCVRRLRVHALAGSPARKNHCGGACQGGGGTEGRVRRGAAARRRGAGSPAPGRRRKAPAGGCAHRRRGRSAPQGGCRRGGAPQGGRRG